MTRVAFDLTYVLPFAACLVALACGHEASTPSAVTIPIAPPVIAPPAVSAPAMAKTADDGVPCVVVDTELGGTHITLEGRVVVDAAFEHPTRGKTRPYILRLDAPRCAKGIDDPQITELHLASSENVALAPLVGKHVRVSGDPFAAHTAWHARPVVLMTTSTTTIARR